MRGAPGKQAGRGGRSIRLPCPTGSGPQRRAGEEAQMAVYTEVSDDELRAFARFYDIGEGRPCKGIAEGGRHATYLVKAESGHLILTLSEKRVASWDLP